MFDIGQRLPSFLRTTLKGYLKGVGGGRVKAVSTIPNTDVTGLGTMSTQNANAVNVTGGTAALASLLTGGNYGYQAPRRQYVITPAGTTTWYHLGDLPADNLGQCVELYVFVLHISGTNPNDGVHQYFKLRVSKGTAGAALGTSYEYNLLGLYDNTGGIGQVRVVDDGTNGASHVDISFATTDTYRVTVYPINQNGESTNFFSDGALASLGTATAGTVIDAINTSYQRGDAYKGVAYSIARSTQAMTPTYLTGTEGLFSGSAIGYGTATTGLYVGSNYGAPRVGWILSSGAADAKVWDVLQTANTLSFRAVNDANTAANTWLNVVRSGYAISSVTFNQRLSAKTFNNSTYYNAGATTTLDMNNGGFQYCSFSANSTLTINNAVQGDELKLFIKNTGASAFTYTMPGTGSFSNSVAAGATDVQYFIYTSSRWSIFGGALAGYSYP